MHATAPATAPKLESALARLGVGVLVFLSIYIGFNFWHQRGEDQLAVMTAAAEIISFAGLGVARYNWAVSRNWAMVGLLLTALAAAWCGMTMFEKIAADSRARAVAAAENTLPYRLAREDLEIASNDLRTALSERRPEAVVMAARIAAWDAAQGAKVSRLEDARDDALARMRQAAPPAHPDFMAMVRGAGVQMIQLLGLAAFGLMGSPAPPAAPARPPRKLPWWRLATLSLGLVAAPAVAAAEIAPALAIEATGAAEAVVAHPASSLDAEAKQAAAPPMAPSGAPRRRAKSAKGQITAAAIERAVKTLARQHRPMGYRSVAAELGVAPSRLYRSEAWRSKWAHA